MKNISTAVGLMPDVALHPEPQRGSTLDWVGMQGIASPVLFDAGDGTLQRCSAKVDAFVNLARADRRGIHMSRLYLLVDEYLSTRALDAGTLAALLRGFLDSHHDMADRARIGVRFEQLVRRPALRSGHSGWRAYPVTVQASLGHEGFRLELSTQVVYSSTCPASAALSRQLIQQQFGQHFPHEQPLEHAAVLAWLGSEAGMVATPHAQRSVAYLRVGFAEDAPMNVIDLIDRVEGALATPVQTAVKREDEQAFALANGGNLMFCEDAARRIYRALDADHRIAAFQVRVEHLESLHPHDAVAWASKGAFG